MREAQSARHWKILSLLASKKQGAAVSQIAREVGAHVRTIYRDLEALCSAGLPISEEVRAGTAFFRWSGPELATWVSLTREEWLALRLGSAEFAVQGLDELGTALRGLARKATGAEPDRTFEQVLRNPRDVDRGGGWFPDLVAAAANRCSLELHYLSAGAAEPVLRQVDPYAVFRSGGFEYLAGHCHQRREVRLFRVDRIKSLRVLSAHFAAPDFSLPGYMAAAFGVTRGAPVEEVHLRFDASVAVLAREQSWPDGARLTLVDDGALDVEAEVAVGEEFVGWLLSLGARAQVLSPQALRSRLADEHLAAAARLRDPSPETHGQLRLFSLAAYSARMPRDRLTGSVKAAR